MVALLKSRNNRLMPFDEQLRDLIQNPPEGSVKMTITPSMAADMLKWNSRNRPCSQGVVQHYARQMKSGDWHYTRVPIIFSTIRLIDGQHRLEAILQSEASVEVDVAFGAEDDAFAFIDVGKTRGASDIFAINGVPNAATMSAAIGWVLRYENASSISKDHRFTKQRLTASELYDAYMEREGLQESMWIGSRFSVCRLASPSMMVALHYVCSQKSRRDADHFFEVAAEGVGAEARSEPALHLHTRLVRNATGTEKMSATHIAGLTLTAWNRQRQGRSGRGQSFNPEKPLPRVR
jgi:hypothetical protein